ncbi:hypothetical protein CASFOL_031248 [Castilleja foliolosa]|uniref:Uncharacterized protein n=1 Tax=Castilleja foliolosa TaxID=1961234 RepID=A0ABD3C6Y3_9LAMI
MIHSTIAIIFTMFVMSSNARLLSEQEPVDNRNTIMRILGINESKLEYYKTRARQLGQQHHFSKNSTSDAPAAQRITCIKWSGALLLKFKHLAKRNKCFLVESTFYRLVLLRGLFQFNQYKASICMIINVSSNLVVYICTFSFNK